MITENNSKTLHAVSSIVKIHPSVGHFLFQDDQFQIEVFHQGSKQHF